MQAGQRGIAIILSGKQLLGRPTAVVGAEKQQILQRVSLTGLMLSDDNKGQCPNCGKPLEVEYMGPVPVGYGPCSNPECKFAVNYDRETKQ